MQLNSVRDFKRTWRVELEARAGPIAGRPGPKALDARKRLSQDAKFLRGVALGVAKGTGARNHVVAVRLATPDLLDHPLLAELKKRARNEVQVRVTPTARFCAWQQKRQRPMLIGSSIGARHKQKGEDLYVTGTIAAFVRRPNNGEETFALSASHVLSNFGAGVPADGAHQPGPLDAWPNITNRFGRVVQFTPFDPEGIVAVDAAIADVRRADVNPTLLRESESREKRFTGLGSAVLDSTVFKIGRTTGCTRGTVSAFELDGVIARGDNASAQLFDGQIEVFSGTRAFVEEGDSGSMLFDEGGMGIGIVFAGWVEGSNHGAFACDLRSSLSALNVVLIS